MAEITTSRLAVYKAIDVLNMTLPRERQVPRQPEARIGEILSSLDKVNLIVETVIAIEEELGQTINLADQQAVAHGGKLFKTLQTFIDYVDSLLEQ